MKKMINYLENRGFKKEIQNKYFNIISETKVEIIDKEDNNGLVTTHNIEEKSIKYKKPATNSKRYKTKYLGLVNVKNHLTNNQSEGKPTNIILVEGEMDCISLLENDFIAVSIAGIGNIKKFVLEELSSLMLDNDDIIIDLLDNDEAGERASLELKELIYKEYKYINLRHILKKQKVKDVNELLIKLGHIKFKNLIQKNLSKEFVVKPSQGKNKSKKTENNLNDFNNLVQFEVVEQIFNIEARDTSKFLIEIEGERTIIDIETLYDFKKMNCILQSYRAGSKSLHPHEFYKFIDYFLEKVANEAIKIKEINQIGYFEINQELFFNSGKEIINSNLEIQSKYRPNIQLAKNNNIIITPKKEFCNNKIKKNVINYLKQCNNIDVFTGIIACIGLTYLKYFWNKLNFSVPIIQIIGSPGTGKTSTLKYIVNPLCLVNSSHNIFDFNQMTPFVISKHLADNNFLLKIIDEIKTFRNSKFDKMSELEMLTKNSYNMGVVQRGTKNQELNEYTPTAPFVIAGEIGTKDKATTERTYILNFVKKPNANQDKNFQNLIYAENELNQIGFEIFDKIIKLNLDELKKDYQILDNDKELEKINARERHNCKIIYASAKIILDIMGYDEETKEEVKQCIISYYSKQAIEEQLSPIEETLETINTMLSNPLYAQMINDQTVIIRKDNFLYIRLNELFSILNEYCKKHLENHLNILDKNSFRNNLKLIEVGIPNKTIRNGSKTMKCFEINILKLKKEFKKIDISNIINEELSDTNTIEEDASENDINMFK